MIENIIVAVLVIITVGGGIGCWWFEHHGRDKE